uniref:Xylulose kinase-1 n=1 Tax=Tanacetum cinerariifolium TaxID=118510 RepID=A0A6L2MPT8_TANCI|nr:xylulose kinase-1 [Tanacetum cinerariifolium]
MMLTFVDTHNMIAYLTKSDVSEGFNQIIDFLNGSSIKYYLTINPSIYVSCIKQFWSSVAVKKVNDVRRLQALVDKKMVIITEAIIRDSLHLDDAADIECLPNKEIFAELARMGYEKPSTKLTFYKAFFSSDLSSHTLKYSSPVLTQKVFANMRRLGKGCSRVETPLFEGMIVEQPVGVGADEVHNEVPAAVNEPSIPSPTPSTPPQPSQDMPFTSQVETSDDTVMDDVSKQGRIIADKDVTLKDVASKDVQDAEIEESLDRKGVVIKDLEETATPSTIIHSEAKSKDKGKGIMVEEPKPIKKQAQIEQDEAYARALEAELNKNINWDEVIDHVQRKQKEDNAGMTYDDIRLIFEKKFNFNVAFLLKTKKQMDEEDSRALKRLSESQEDKASKKQNLDEEIITYTTTQLILLVERRYPLTRFTLDQMLNNVRLEVEEESKVSLELLSFGVDAAKDFKKNMLSD